MSKDKIRNWLNIIFMIMAVIGVIFFLQKNEEKHMMGLYIILCAMSVKIVESSMRMIK
jgi:multisubunit Na+/H+ antiporter MnhC subunit